MEKKLIILSGVPGAGKSTICEGFKKQYGDDCVLSPDTIREMCGAIVYDENGNPVCISQKLNRVVFEIYNKMMDVRMSTGAATVLDATHVDARSMANAKMLAEKYGYSVEVHRLECSLETLLKRNTQRGYKNVPEDVVRNMYERFTKMMPADWYTLVVHNTDN